MVIEYRQIREELIEDEGYCLLPYTDTVGKLSIGVGRNLTDRGLSKEEVEYLLENDIYMVDRQLRQHLPWFEEHHPSVQRALYNLCFNLGITKLLKFTTTLGYIEARRYNNAVENLKKTKWARQVQRTRSERIYNLLREGKNAENT